MNNFIIFVLGRSQPYGYYSHEMYDIAAKSLVIVVCAVSIIFTFIFLIKVIQAKNKKLAKSQTTWLIVSAIVSIGLAVLILSPAFRSAWF